jgi:hemoglobin
MATLFDSLGPEKLRAIVVDFYDRVFDDAMIGFLFWGKDKERLIQLEWEHTARLLGADVVYTGRSIREAHAKVPILGGHFARRLRILEEVLDAHAVPHAVRRTWIEHTNAMRALVTHDPSSECDHDRSAKRVGDPDPEAR